MSTFMICSYCLVESRQSTNTRGTNSYIDLRSDLSAMHSVTPSVKARFHRGKDVQLAHEVKKADSPQTGDRPSQRMHNENAAQEVHRRNVRSGSWPCGNAIERSLTDFRSSAAKRGRVCGHIFPISSATLTAA